MDLLYISYTSTCPGGEDAFIREFDEQCSVINNDLPPTASPTGKTTRSLQPTKYFPSSTSPTFMNSSASTSDSDNNQANEYEEFPGLTMGREDDD